MKRLFIDSDNASALRLAEAASKVLQNEPSLLQPLHDGSMALRAPLPEGYKRGMNHWATELRARISSEGYLFEISEISNGVSGGWMASCIPPALYATFLSSWLKSVRQPRQIELF